mgnify:CR=1 FL=1
MNEGDRRRDGGVRSELRLGGGLSIFQPLRIPQYRRYMAAFLGSGVAFQTSQVALGWQTFDLTDDVGALGAVLFVLGAVQAVMAPIGGVIADRWERQRSIIGSHGINIIGVIVMGVIAATGNIQTWHLNLQSWLLRAIAAVNMPASQA